MASKTKKPPTIVRTKRNRTARLAKLITKALYLYRRKKIDRMYAIICDEFIALGGVYIKFLQGVLLRSELMRNAGGTDKHKIFENVDSEPLDIHAILHKELGPKVNHIALIQPQPFAAGSFGQVYYGQHINGKPIIIKVLRPMIRELLKYDLKLLTGFSRNFLLKLYPNMDVQMDEALREFRNSTLRETDYVEEARFAHEMFIAYKDHETFIIPETYLDICTPNVIVQDYVDGMSVAQLIKLQDQGIDPVSYVRDYIGSDLDTQLSTLGIELMYGVFSQPRIQGDPHPGNVRLLSNNRVGLIDFGISAPSPRNRSAYFGLLDQYAKLYNGSQTIADLFEQLMRFFMSDLYRALKKLSAMATARSGVHADFSKDLGRIAQETFSHMVGTDDIRPMLEDGSIMKTLNKIVNRDNRFGLVMKLESSEVIRAAQTYATLVESLHRHKYVFPVAYNTAVERIRKSYPDLAGGSSESMSMHNAIETVTNWLERVAERDPALFQQLVSHIRINNKSVKEVKADA